MSRFFFSISAQPLPGASRPWPPGLCTVGSLTILLWAAPGCSEDDPDRVVVFAASSMSQALEEVESKLMDSHPGIDLELVIAGSQTLAMQINEGARADLFISADLNQMQRVEHFSTPALLVHNRLVAIATPGFQASTLTDAIERSTQIIVAHRDVPVGRYTQLALEELGVWRDAEAKIVSYEHSARGVLSKVALGQADLGIVYWTDALSEIDRVRVIEFPTPIHVTTQTWIAQSNDSLDEHSPSSVVSRYLTSSPESQRVFTKRGFEHPGDSP